MLQINQIKLSVEEVPFVKENGTDSEILRKKELELLKKRIYKQFSIQNDVIKEVRILKNKM